MQEQRRRRDQSWDAGSIRKLREHLGLTQAGLADELNTRQQTISEWERGEYRPRGPAARLLTPRRRRRPIPLRPRQPPRPARPSEDDHAQADR